MGEGTDKDVCLAVECWKKAASWGDPKAQNCLGDYYFQRKDGAQSSQEEAIKWWMKAGDYNSHSKLFHIDSCDGLLEFEKYYEASKWWSANLLKENDGKEDDNFQVSLKTKSTSVKWMKAAAEKENAEAQYELGKNFYYGENVKQDYVEAAKWWRKSAEQGVGMAQFNLSCCLHKGQGVEKNQNEAILWCRKAAEQGVVKAQYVLGVCYWKGEGVEQDFGQTLKWFSKAAKNGDKKAKEALIYLGVKE